MNQSGPDQSLVRRTPHVPDPQIWTSLDPSRKEIRLLCLAPAKELQDDLVIHLLVVSLLELQLQYEALSWAWRGDDRSCEAMINGHRCFINRNLASALRRIRASEKEMILWADAICINQDDTIERNTQILLMRTVYTFANSVFIWVGESNNETATLFEIFETCRDDEDLFEFKLKNKTSLLSHVQAINNFFARPWFHRSWIVQELTLARTPYVFCGGYVVLFEHVARFIRSVYKCLLNYTMSSVHRVTDFAKLPVANMHVNMLVSMRESYTESRGFSIAKEPIHDLSDERRGILVLLDILMSCRHSQTTDPRDKIYAFLGLLPERHAVLIQPEYEKDCQQVYIDFATLMVSEGLVEPMFTQAGLSQRKLCIQNSWCPDWSEPGEGALLKWNQYTDTRSFAATLPKLRSSSQSVKVERTGLLIIKGAILDCLSRTDQGTYSVDPSTLQIQVGMKMSDWIDLVSTTFQHEGESPYILCSTLQDAFWRTILLDTSPPPFAKWSPRSRANITDRTNLAMLMYTFLDSQRWAVVSDILGSRIDPQLSEHDAHSIFKWYVKTPGSCRQRLGITHYGCLGLFPQDFQAGDVICLLEGCSWPILLRRVRAKRLQDVKVAFQLVGLCYVHGMMDLNARPSDTGTEADFEEILRTSSHPRTPEVVEAWRGRVWKDIHII